MTECKLSLLKTRFHIRSWKDTGYSHEPNLPRLWSDFLNDESGCQADPKDSHLPTGRLHEESEHLLYHLNSPLSPATQRAWLWTRLHRLCPSVSSMKGTQLQCDLIYVCIVKWSPPSSSVTHPPPHIVTIVCVHVRVCVCVSLFLCSGFL